MKVLLYSPPQRNIVCWDASTIELRDAAYFELFKMILWDLKGFEPPVYLRDSSEAQLLVQAKAGNVKLAQALLLLRQGLEYEDFVEIEMLPNPASIVRQTRQVMINHRMHDYERATFNVPHTQGPFPPGN